MLGYTREELCCSTASDLLVASEKERMVNQHFMRMEGVGQYGIDDTTLVHKNGSEVSIEFNVTPITYEGENASFISIRDITERKRMQEELELSEQIQFSFHSCFRGCFTNILLNCFLILNTHSQALS